MSASPGFEVKDKSHPVEHLEHHGIRDVSGGREVASPEAWQASGHGKMYGAGRVGSHLIL